MFPYALLGKPGIRQTRHPAEGHLDIVLSWLSRPLIGCLMTALQMLSPASGTTASSGSSLAHWHASNAPAIMGTNQTTGLHSTWGDSGTLRSLVVPGGRRALESVETVELFFDDDSAWSGVAATDRTLVRSAHALLCASARDSD
jgi:hypothetical protein